MKIMVKSFKATMITATILAISIAYPLPVFAQETTPGPKQPTGVGSHTYSYNESSGLWENDHYTWDPVSKQTKPKQTQDYSYNPDTGMWDTKEWVYDAPSKTYKENMKTTSPSSIPQKTQPHASPTALPNDNKAQSATSSDASQATQGHNAGTNSESAFDLFYNSSISNTINNTVDSTAATGDAKVTANTQAGSATSGDALTIANVFNLLQSYWSGLKDDGIVTFISNIFGNVSGDIFIDPDKITNIQNSSPTEHNFDVNIANNNAINNTINLAVQSGDAEVSQNTNASGATSGSASAVANVMNLINSVVSAGKSFFGMINIHGNLEGDILLPEQFLQNLLATNAPSATMDPTNLKDKESLASFTSNHSIANNVNLESTSGNVTVANNTTAGDATTGDAATRLTIFNLTGQNVIGSDSLLVFVNVLGEWIGMIVNAPGSNAAALGSASSEANKQSSLADSDVSITTTGSITNNVNVVAKSGNATITQNTTAGDAASGNAIAIANVANIANSSINLSNWFGILIINVFGTWRGSFGLDTPYGNLTATELTSQSPVAATNPRPPQVFRFIPSGNGQYRTHQIEYTEAIENQVLASSNQFQTDGNSRQFGSFSSNEPPAGVSGGNTLTATQEKNWWIPAVGVMISIVILLVERMSTILQRRRLISPS